MAIVTGDRYLEKLVKFLEEQTEPLIEGTKVLKLNPAGLHYVHLRLDALQELELMLSGAPVDYLRAYVSDLGDYRALEQLRRILRLLTSLKVVSAFPPPARDPTPLSIFPFGNLKVLELRGCDLSTSAAKGLLELRHTLEKIICHNSTDALRHVFASRITEIKDSPQWNKLSFVSCACNRLVLMDESLQLLPAIETLDLSRNKFAKVDNLGKCTKLKHLDLGFNHLRTISHFREVSCHIVKLVLRNNALTTICGIENLKSLEELDVSYNIISNFFELEILGNLIYLRSLWLEGNPICCARWYRPQVFSYFVYPHNLKLDNKEIGNREFWKRQIIIARRQKQPASIGFYVPAKVDPEGEGNGNRKKKNVSRLASICSEDESTYVCSDQESSSCENRSKDDNVKSDDEAEIVDLINKVEHLKKERSVLWLRDFKEWMDHSTEDLADVINHYWDNHPEEQKSMKIKKNQMGHGESSRYAAESVQASGDEVRAQVSANLADGLVQQGNGNGSLETTDEILSLGTQRLNLEEMDSRSLQPKRLLPDNFFKEDQRTAENDRRIMIDDIRGLPSNSTNLGSPPHYQKDVLHRRNNLVEEILQLSADSFSVASSDSMTSSSNDEIYDSDQSCHEDSQLVDQGLLDKTKEQHFTSGVSENHDYQQQKDSPENTSSIINNVQSLISEANNFFTRSHGAELVSLINQNVDWFEKRKSRRKPKRRVVSSLENDDFAKRETCHERDLDVHGAASEDKCNRAFTKQIQENLPAISSNNNGSWNEYTCLVDEYFVEKLADSRIQETCSLQICCGCVLGQDSSHNQREVVLLITSENKLHVLLACSSPDTPGNKLSLWGTHRVEDVCDISVGLGLQVVRLHIGEDAIYLFITKSIDKSTELLHLLQLCYSQATKTSCSFRSLEHVQVKLFEKQICGGLKLSIFQYTMLDFHCSMFGDSWLPRSLFVAGRHLFICIEDFTHFSSLSVDTYSSSYLSLHVCCTISDVSEIVIDSKKSTSLSLSIKRTASEFCPVIDQSKKPGSNCRKGGGGGPTIWKLKWCNEESLVKFVTLVKALHADSTHTSLLVRHSD